VQTRRPGKQTDHKVSPGALAAIAEAARRSREAGVGPEPRRSRPERPGTGGVTDRPVSASSAPQATQPPVATAPAGRPPTVPATTPGAGPTPAPSSDTLRWAGSPPPAWAPGLAESPAGLRPPRTRRSGSSERRLRWAIGIALGVLFVVVAAVVGTTNRGDQQSGGQATATTRPSGGAGAAPRGSTGTTSGQGVASSPSTSIPTPTSTSTSAPTTLAEPDGPPALSALAPATGQAGQTVTVTGSNFLSSSGRISAQVEGQIAPVACPAQTTCTVVIPPDPGPAPSAPLTITTDSGTSNALVFTYGTPTVVGVLQTPACAVAGPCNHGHPGGRHHPHH
jgi:hypothetical protein